MKVAFDNGNVLCESDTDFLNHGDLSAARRIPGGFEVIKTSVQKYGADANWILSKCGPRVQGYSWDWFLEQQLFEFTGLSEHPSCFVFPKDYVKRDQNTLVAELHRHRVIFCHSRAEKAVVAALLGLDAMIDDRLDILAPMPDCTDRRILFRPNRRDRVLYERDFLADCRYHLVDAWESVATLLEL